MFAPKKLALAALVTSLLVPSAQAIIKTPIFLRIAEHDYAAENRAKFKGKGKYKATVELEKGTYHFRLADKEFSCGTSFGPEAAEKIKFKTPVPVSDCATDTDFSIRILFPGEYEFTLDTKADSGNAISVMRKPKKVAVVRKPPAVDCGTWDGNAVEVNVSSVFKDGELVKDFYSGQTAEVAGGKVSMQPSKESGGLLLLEPAEAKPSDFDWDNASVYFIMTDRFNNGDTSNDYPFNRKKDGKLETGTFQGGDIKGIIEKLDYIQELGMNAIWLTPIVEQIHGFIGGGEKGSFPFYGYHGYWALDFTRLDPNFGTDEDLERLVTEAHKRGIRVVIDVVMNHAGYPTLDDMQTFDINALAPNAPVPDQWTDWVPDEKKGQNWHRYNNYIRWGSSEWAEKWWGPDWVRSGMAGYTAPGGDDITMNLAGLPDFLTESEKHVGLPPILKNKPDTRAVEREGYTVVDYLVEWHTTWVRKYGIDGFRADTVKHVEAEVWTKLKDSATKALAEWKAENPDKAIDDKPFWMVGEVWHHGAYKDFYFDHGMDSLINFDYAGEMQAVKGAQCINQNEDLYATYAKDINTDPDFNLLTYISSHDTKLFFQRYENLELQKGAANGLLLMPGGVQIYYGDESGRPAGPMSDAFDSPTRSFMNWDQLKGDRAALVAHWQKVGQFRNNHVAVGAGEHKMLSEQPYAFSRVKGDDRVVVVYAGEKK
ncbi:alpha-amylase [Corallincola spongiicola]|uniref:Alpha-amylase n=1 Tax=Corallincola spongiicola TaxID=2520508 RepID=A0ABY1WPE8_9GAMM|nr:alpha-amylase [Corallincola spongiicola]TAA45945.1 alpha-amylase [Corallincola spongiicola]